MDFDQLHDSADSVEDFAEEFVFGRLEGDTRHRYEQHLLDCLTCQKAVEATLELIRLLRKSSDLDPSG